MDIRLSNGKSIKVSVIKNGEIYEYYIKGIKIGVYNPKVMEDNILILQNTLENELSSQIKDDINSIRKEQIVVEAEINKNIQKYASEIGIDRIRDITVVELEKEEKKNEKQQNDEETKIIQEVQRRKETEITKNKVKDVNVKQEIDLSERANDMHDFKKWIGGKIPSEFTKIAVIESDEMSSMKNEQGDSYKNNSTRYSLVIVNKDGNIEPLQKYIPNLKQRDAAGNNPMQQKYQVDKDGNVEKDAVLSEYEIGNKILQIDNKEMGRVELNIGQEEHGGNETVSVQMRDSNSTFAIDTQTRAVISEYESNGEYNVDKNIEEAEQHIEKNSDCEKMTREDIDGDLKTKSHNHLDDIDFGELATKWGFYKDGIPDQEKAKEVLLKEIDKNPTKDIEKTIDDITEEMEEDFGAPGIKR